VIDGSAPTVRLLNDDEENDERAAASAHRRILA